MSKLTCPHCNSNMIMFGAINFSAECLNDKCNLHVSTYSNFIVSLKINFQTYNIILCGAFYKQQPSPTELTIYKNKKSITPIAKYNLNHYPIDDLHSLYKDIISLFNKTIENQCLA